MNVTREDLPDRQVALTIALDNAEIEPALQKAYRQLVGRVNIPGFRPGKAPRNIFERYAGREMLVQQAVESLLTTPQPEAVKEQGLDADNIADVEVMSTNPVVVKVLVDQPALVALPDYSDIRVERETAEVPPERTDEVITAMRRREGTWVTPAEPRPARLGDRVVVDMETYTIDGPVRNMTGEDQSMELTANAAATWPGEIDQNIAGLLPDEEKDFAITFPPAYPDEELRGKDATVHVKLKKIEEMILPDLDDAFAERTAGVPTVDDLRERVQTNLQHEAEETAEGKQVDEVIRLLVERATAEVPKHMIDHDVDHRMEDLTEVLRERHIDARRYFSLTGTSEAEWRTAQREPARKRLQQTLVLREFTRREGIPEVSDEEVAQQIEQQLEPYAGTPSAERLRELFSSDDQKHRIENELFERRLRDRLIAVAEGRATPPAPAEPAEAEAPAEAAPAEETAEPAAAEEATPTETEQPDEATAPTPAISGATPATAQEPGPLETAGGAAEVLGVSEARGDETAAETAGQS